MSNVIEFPLNSNEFRKAKIKVNEFIKNFDLLQDKHRLGLSFALFTAALDTLIDESIDSKIKLQATNEFQKILCHEALLLKNEIEDQPQDQ